jgi:hypothetical protein
MIPSAVDMRRVSENPRGRAHNPAFDQVLLKAAKVVREAAKQRYGSVAYKIPDYVQGYPVYKIPACAEYVMRVFANKGFAVSLEATNLVVIRWGQHESAAHGVPQTRAPAADDPDDKFSRLSLGP